MRLINPLVIASLILAAAFAAWPVSPAAAQYDVVEIDGEFWYVLIDDDFALTAGQTVYVAIPQDVAAVRYVYRCWQLNTDGDSRMTASYNTSWEPCRQVTAGSLPYPAPDDTAFTYQISSYPADWGAADEEVRLNNYHGSAGSSVRLQLLGLQPSTPTATPTPAPATPAPIFAACIPAAQVAAATPTRTAIAPTPFGTRTPTPTATPGTPAPTATPAPAGLNDLAQFGASLSPWTSNTNPPPVLQRGDLPGPNGQPGIAYLPFAAGSVRTVPGDLEPPAITPAGNHLVFSRSAIPGPVRLVADVQYPGLMEGQYAYLQVYYWQDGGLGTAAWTYAGAVRLNVAWHTVTFLITPLAGRPPVRAVSLRAIVGNGPLDNPLGFGALDLPGQGAQVDNLRITAGPDANNPAAVGLPVCNGAAPGGPPSGQVPRKQCVIKAERVDVFNCPRPTSLTDVGGWLSWVVCNVVAYFTFHPENYNQLVLIRERNAGYQPFAAVSEVVATLYAIGEVTAVLSTIPAVSVQSPDWETIWDARVLDQPLSIPAPELGTGAGEAMLSAARLSCPAAIADYSVTLAPYACLMVYQVRGSILNNFFQWLFDLICYGWLLNLFLRAVKAWDRGL